MNEGMEWTSVEDKLPDDGCDCIVLHISRPFTHLFARYDQAGNTFDWDDPFLNRPTVFLDVTHYIEIPVLVTL